MYDLSGEHFTTIYPNQFDHAITVPAPLKTGQFSKDRLVVFHFQKGLDYIFSMRIRELDDSINHKNE